MNLTIDQLAAIDWQLRHKRLLQNEELIAELTDHFAVAISEQMMVGQSFNEAGETVMTMFGGWVGLVKLQKDYVQAQNRAAWATFGRVALSYLITPRLLLTLLLLVSTYYLLQAYWERAFYGLGSLNVTFSVLISFGVNALNKQKWSRQDLKELTNKWAEQPVAAIRNSQAGARWVINIMGILAFNVPINLYLFFFPFTFDRSFNPSFTVYATIGFVVSYIGYFCIAELIYRHHPLFNRFAR